jgi:hypothetical protein
MTEERSGTIVLRFAFGDAIEHLEGEKSTGKDVLPDSRALCAYRFRRATTDSAFPWIVVYPQDLKDVRGALARQLEPLCGGRSLETADDERAEPEPPQGLAP